MDAPKFCMCCGVPLHLHATCCGWDNAHLVVFQNDNLYGFAATTSAEEKELRWLISQSPNAEAIAAKTFPLYNDGSVSFVIKNLNEGFSFPVTPMKIGD